MASIFWIWWVVGGTGPAPNAQTDIAIALKISTRSAAERPTLIHVRKLRSTRVIFPDQIVVCRFFPYPTSRPVTVIVLPSGTNPTPIASAGAQESPARSTPMDWTINST